MSHHRSLDDRPLVLIHDAPVTPLDVETPAVSTVACLRAQSAQNPQRRRDARRAGAEPQITGGRFAGHRPYRADENREHKDKPFHAEIS
jgi:hypothetical protein